MYYNATCGLTRTLLKKDTGDEPGCGMWMGMARVEILQLENKIKLLWKEG